MNRAWNSVPLVKNVHGLGESRDPWDSVHSSTEGAIAVSGGSCRHSTGFKWRRLFRRIALVTRLADFPPCRGRRRSQRQVRRPSELGLAFARSFSAKYQPRSVRREAFVRLDGRLFMPRRFLGYSVVRVDMLHAGNWN